MPAGRPKKTIDYETAEKLAQIFCTQTEIASFLNVSPSKLQHDKKFIQVYKKGLEIAKISLRRKQFILADKNAAMAIFLGKNYLGQKDVQTIDAEQKIRIEQRIKEISDKTPEELIAEINQALQNY